MIDREAFAAYEEEVGLALQYEGYGVAVERLDEVGRVHTRKVMRSFKSGESPLSCAHGLIADDIARRPAKRLMVGGFKGA